MGAEVWVGVMFTQLFSTWCRLSWVFLAASACTLFLMCTVPALFHHWLYKDLQGCRYVRCGRGSKRPLGRIPAKCRHWWECHREVELRVHEGNLTSTFCRSHSRVGYQRVKKPFHQFLCHVVRGKRIKWIHCPPVGGSSHTLVKEQFQVIFLQSLNTWNKTVNSSK